MTVQQTYTQASDLYILGGSHEIHHNVFENARNLFVSNIEKDAPNFFDYMP